MRKQSFLAVISIAALSLSPAAFSTDAQMVTRTLTAVSAGSMAVEQSVGRITVEADAFNRPVSLKTAALVQAPVKYPVASLKRGHEGRVLLDFAIDAKGRVRGFVVRRSSGSDRLDAAAMTAAKGWSFEPEVQNGNAVAARALMPVDFRIALAD